jgi:adenylate cyclase
MPTLTARGPKPGDAWRMTLVADEPVIIGREAGEWSVSWDNWISRKHVQVTWRPGGFLAVQRLSNTANPIYFAGKESDRFEITPGGHFVIGTTSFLIEGDQQKSATASEPSPVEERTVSVPELERLPFRDAARPLDVLGRLPEVIARAGNDAELCERLSDLLLEGLARADVVALVDASHPPDVNILHQRSRREGTEFRPSHKLVQEGVNNRRQAVLHLWGMGGDAKFTASGGFDWAFCTPVRDEGARGWGIYAAGRLSGDPSATVLGPLETSALRDDLKFADLAAAILGSLRQVRLLQRRQASLRAFFSPAVRHALADADPDEALRAREADVSVLFCDLRGFSLESERQSGDLMALLQRVSKALGVMTQSILDEGGVIGDFQGDAALGFWGWPLPQPDMALRAAGAALIIRSTFEAAGRQTQHPLSGFRVGIGIASGRAVVGKIGAAEQSKVGAFGPVVNLASRLEGMTKILQVPILLDEATAAQLRESMPPGAGRCRRLAVVRPKGLDQSVAVSELMPPLAEYPAFTDDDLRNYEQALDAFVKQDWTAAYDLLHRVTSHDRAKDFLLGHILQNNRTPPAGWDGVVALERKS